MHVHGTLTIELLHGKPRYQVTEHDHYTHASHTHRRVSRDTEEARSHANAMATASLPCALLHIVIF